MHGHSISTITYLTAHYTDVPSFVYVGEDGPGGQASPSRSTLDTLDSRYREVVRELEATSAPYYSTYYKPITLGILL